MSTGIIRTIGSSDSSTQSHFFLTFLQACGTLRHMTYIAPILGFGLGLLITLAVIAILLHRQGTHPSQWGE